MAERATRANGEASRRRILDAALEIAGERGYSGTSISEVSKRSGLPNSSIYWHFTDKDALFAAVIEDSYVRWRQDYSLRVQSPGVSAGDAVVRLHESLMSFPAFLRFGHLVILEQHEMELSARRAFTKIRKDALRDMSSMFQRIIDCDRQQANKFSALALALVDGAFLAGVAGEKTVADSSMLGEMFNAYVESTREKSESR